MEDFEEEVGDEILDEVDEEEEDDDASVASDDSERMIVWKWLRSRSNAFSLSSRLPEVNGGEKYSKS
jgi:hypothetical protein